MKRIIAVIILSATLMGCKPQEAQYGGSCRVVAPDADHDTGQMEAIASRHGGVEYRGRDYNGKIFGVKVGTWTFTVNGKVFGFSMEEDGIVYSTSWCAMNRPTYNS